MQLPRVLAYLDDSVVAREDLGVALAAAAAAGPDLAIVARIPSGTADQLATLAARCVSHASPPGAKVLISGRMDIAVAIGADGAISRAADLPPSEMRLVDGTGSGRIVLASVHSESEAETALKEGADGLVVGTIWPTDSHPGGVAAGPDLIARCAEFDRPVYAIGGVTRERARQAREAGAWGVAAISALWQGDDTYRAAVSLISVMKGD